MDFKELEKKLREADSFQLFGHINPDGDSVGAVLAMTYILEQYFGKKNINIMSRDASPSFFTFLPGSERIKAHDGTAPGEKVDLSLLLDCGSPKRVGGDLAGHVRNAHFTAVVDHHATNEGFGDLNLTDPHASSTCEVLCRFVEAAGIDPDPQLASYLYTGIMYDTGRFIHSNTTPEVFQHCARLVEKGADPSTIATNTFGKRPLSHLKLLGYVLSNFQTVEDDAISYISISRATFNTLNASEEDNEGVVEAMGGYVGCDVHTSIMELPDGKIRVSMRSTGRVNVGQICKDLGGGGHDLAAGVRLDIPLEEATEKVINASKAALAEINKMEAVGD